MIEKRKPLPIQDAVQAVLTHKKQSEVDYVPLSESDHRYLAEDVQADHDVPPFDKSPLDGFAIRAEDTTGASSHSPVQLEVIEEIGAGSVASKVPGRKQAIRIMTGAQIPKGTDAIVMFELTKELTKDNVAYIEIKRAFQPGDNISFQGEDVKAGTPLIEKGRKIDPGVQALLATFGYANVPVFKKPVVSIYATGTELLEVEEELQPGKIRNSNAYMVASQVRRVGAEPKYLGKLVDDFDQCYQAVRQALKEADVLITTGGVSVGDYDYLPEIYKKLGANVLFNKVAMRPGSVTTVAEWNGKLLFGLSGNPSACYVGFELFARPILQSYLAVPKPHLQREQAILDADFPKPNPFTRFVRSTVTINEGCLYVRPTGLDKSGVVTSLSDANALLVLPGGTRGYEKGMSVDVLLLNGEGSEWPWE